MILCRKGMKRPSLCLRETALQCIYIYASSSFLCDFQVSSLPGVSKAQYEQVEDSNLCMFDSTVEPSSPQKVGGFMVTQRSSETQKAIHTISYNTSNTFKYLSDAWSKLLFLLNCPKMDLKLLWDLASWFQVMKRCQKILHTANLKSKNENVQVGTSVYKFHTKISKISTYIIIILYVHILWASRTGPTSKLSTSILGHWDFSPAA